MTATVLPSAAPPHAIRIWADERSIYAELPSINGPYVAAFARTEGGLSSALHILGAMHAEHTAGEPYHRLPVTNKALAEKGITAVDLNRARETLKKLGVL